MASADEKSIDKDSQITALQAFDALVRFLEQYKKYNPGAEEALDGLLSLLYYSELEAGGPNSRDPRVWDDWLEGIGSALREPLLKR